MDKRGSASEWFLVIVVVLVVGGLVLFISSRMFYTKAGVDKMLTDTKEQIKSEGYSKCQSVLLTDSARSSSYKSEYLGKTPKQICNDLNKDLKFLNQIYNFGIYTGDTAATCDDYQKNDLTFSVSEFRLADESEFDKALTQQSGEPTCITRRNTYSRGFESTVNQMAICC
ncbi:MAG TPA: hypothetical protein VJB94_00300 [Candidatus Nanoarchaeia archaeon]|nr:hypothetical protein [Candidatus Nanoarchaeia archaeon]